MELRLLRQGVAIYMSLFYNCRNSVAAKITKHITKEIDASRGFVLFCFGRGGPSRDGHVILKVYGELRTRC